MNKTRFVALYVRTDAARLPNRPHRPRGAAATPPSSRSATRASAGEHHEQNAATDAPIGPNTVQGYSATSCWARGQAWGLYGFTTMYRRTGNTQFPQEVARAEAVVARCTRNRPAEDGIEISLPYADYFLLEGILRVLRPEDVDRAIDLSTT